MAKELKKLTQNFMICGLTGWCLEILFTAFHSFRKRDLTLTGNTSIWMFPIYGMAAFLLPVYHRIKKHTALVRGSIYAFFIFSVEFISGSLLLKKSFCPWDYSRSRFHIRKVIRLDFAPVWFFTGLLYEKLLCLLERH